MKIAALQGEKPARLFADADPMARCVFCGRPRPSGTADYVDVLALQKASAVRAAANNVEDEKEGSMTEQREFTGFNAVVDPTAQEQKQPPTISDSFMVHVQSADCNCLVVAIGEAGGVRRVFTHNRCNKGWRVKLKPEHELMLKELEQLARSRVFHLIELMRDQHA
jgi:hypothetical protein